MAVEVALAHDYLTQYGGAERVVLSMLGAFPMSPLHTSLYAPERTFPDFLRHDVRTLPINRMAVLRVDHRRALPLLAPAFSRLQIDADIVICSSSGWAHGACTSGRKIVYCHTPARWLYQSKQYLRESRRSARAALAVLGPSLRGWDLRAAQSADLYITNSRAVQDRIKKVYDIEATIVPPPHTLDPAGRQRELQNLAPGYLLCVSRLLPYKNVDAIVRAFSLDSIRDRQLVVVGDGPDRPRLLSLAGANAVLLPTVNDAELRWLYANSSGIVAAAYEDFGLTPLEAASLGKPAAVLRWGGYLDTVIDGSTGVFFDEPEPRAIASAVETLLARSWDTDALLKHAEQYSEESFRRKLQVVATGNMR